LGTPEENKAATEGSIAYFGTYALSGDSITLRLEGSTFPNWNGIEQKRTVKISGDELKLESPVASSGAPSVNLTFKRAK
jgi:Lipocalin-like domain